MIDTDIGLRNLDVVMGIENRIVFDLVDVAEGRCKLPQALVHIKKFKELYLLPAAQTRDKSAVTPEQMREIINELRPDFDYILIDCPAGIEQGFKNAVAGADKAIVVTTPEISSMRDADRIIGMLEDRAELVKLVEPPKLIINRVRGHLVKEDEMLDVEDIVRMLSIDLLGVVEDDEAVLRATNTGEPVVSSPNGKASLAYRNIARRLLGESVPLQPLDQGKTGVLTKVKKFLGIR